MPPHKKHATRHSSKRTIALAFQGLADTIAPSYSSRL
jgi:hypothetical protein